MSMVMHLLLNGKVQNNAKASGFLVAQILMKLKLSGERRMVSSGMLRPCGSCKNRRFRGT
jgi:hypothetical protein